MGRVRRQLKSLVFVLCALPLAWLLTRAFGLYACACACACLSLHFLNWLVLDQWFGIRRARGRRSRANATARLEAQSTTAAG
jgi:hypothetical protein